MMSIGSTGVMSKWPTLPSECGSGDAALWAASVLMFAALERNWPVSDVRQLVMTLAILTDSDESEAAIRSDFEAALVQVQAQRAAKQ